MKGRSCGRREPREPPLSKRAQGTGQEQPTHHTSVQAREPAVRTDPSFPPVS